MLFRGLDENMSELPGLETSAKQRSCVATPSDRIASVLFCDGPWGWGQSGMPHFSGRLPAISGLAAFQPLPLSRRAVIRGLPVAFVEAGCCQRCTWTPVAPLLTQNTKGMPFPPGFSRHAFYVLTLASASTEGLVCLCQLVSALSDQCHCSLCWWGT